MMFYTYSHHKPDGTPFYVGKGSTRTRMMVCHRRSTRHQRTVDKYGKENIVVKVYECSTEAEAFALEKLQIMQCRFDGYDLVNHAIGGVGGTTGYKASAETRAKLSVLHKGHTYNVGRKHTDDARANMSQFQKGRPKSPEHRARIAAAHTGKRGRVCSNTTRQKMSESQQRAWARRKGSTS